MAQKEVLIPRHTILAATSKRVASFFIDLAIVGATFMILFFALFNPVFSNFVTKEDDETIVKYQLNSHLFVEENGVVTILSSEDDYQVFETPIRYFYMNYLTGEGIEEGVAAPNYNQKQKNETGEEMLPKDYYTVSWYNKNVLGIDPSVDPENEKSTCYFTYPKNGDEYDKTQFGIPRSERYSKDLNKVVPITGQDLVGYMRPKYQNAYEHLTEQEFFHSVRVRVNFYTGVSVTIPLFISGLICYTLIPLFFKYGSTLGKRLMGLGLANKDGYAYKKIQLLPRFIPTTLVLLFMTFVHELNLMTMTMIVLAILLASVATMIATPKHMALHDLTALTMVIDYKESIIFNNSFEELEYIEMEEKKDEARHKERLMSDKTKYDDETEEPEISYEK